MIKCKEIENAFKHMLYVLILIFYFDSLITVTFVTESMAAANALVHSRTVRHMKKIMKTDEEGSEENSQQLVVCLKLLLVLNI